MADILPTGAGQLPYNQFTGGSWTQGTMTNNDYAAVFVMAAPVTSADLKSNSKRFLFIQPQTVNGALSTIQALSTASLNLGQFSSPEYCFIAKIIVRSSVSNGWTIISAEKLTGSRLSQTSTASGYLSIVTTDSSISGNGTPLSPIGLTSASLRLTNTPLTSSSSGVVGYLAIDSTYLYVCTSTNIWKRVALSSW